MEWKELICFRTPKRTGDFAWIGFEFVKVVIWMLYPATINALGSGLSVVHFYVTHYDLGCVSGSRYELGRV